MTEAAARHAAGERHWLDHLSCGHTRIVEIFVPIDRAARLGHGEYAVVPCYKHDERQFVSVTSTEEIPLERWDVAGG